MVCGWTWTTVHASFRACSENRQRSSGEAQIERLEEEIGFFREH
jgi:hypothetical protein